MSESYLRPRPNCNKSFKRADGVKDHLEYGKCYTTPPKDLEKVQVLLSSKSTRRRCVEVNNEDVDTSGIVSEAERPLRPFACGVDDCQRRYKNMNGLRWHYLHSGEHGAIGLAILASGQHKCLDHVGGGFARSSRHLMPSQSTAEVSVTQGSQQGLQLLSIKSQCTQIMTPDRDDLETRSHASSDEFEIPWFDSDDASGRLDRDSPTDSDNDLWCSAGMNEAEDEKTKKAVWSPGTGFYHAQRPVDIFIKPVELSLSNLEPSDSSLLSASLSSDPCRNIPGPTQDQHLLKTDNTVASTKVSSHIHYMGCLWSDSTH